MYHTFANFVSVTGSTDTDVTPVPDGILSVQNGHFVPPQDMWLYAAYSGSLNLARVKLVSPSLRQIANPYIRPVSLALLPPTDANFMDLRRHPLRLHGQEELQVLETSTAGTQNHYTVLFAGDQQMQPWPAGDVFPMRWTATTTLTASAWTSVAVTFEQTIPAGAYAAVLSEQWGTTAIAHRWTFDGQFYRPGFLSTALGTSALPKPLYQGGFGVVGMFRNNTLPRLEVLANAADTAEEGYLWAIKVG